MARSNVPQFGDWENDGNVPYTVYFEKARKNKGGKMINPNDPTENPEMFANAAYSDSDPTPARPPSRQRVQQEETTRDRVTNATIQHRESREDNEFRQFADSPARHRNGGRVTATTDSPHHQSGSRGTSSARPARLSGGSERSEHSIERSPLHTHHQARLTGRGSGSPSWEGKRTSDTSHGTPGRSRMKPKAPEAPARDVIPQFGAWNVNDPQSADNYTYIFNQNAKGAANVRETNSAPSPYHSTTKDNTDDEVKFSQRCCFSLPWGKK